MRVVVVIPTDCSSRQHAFEIVQKLIEHALCHAPIAMHIEGTPEILGLEDDPVTELRPLVGEAKEVGA